MTISSTTRIAGPFVGNGTATVLPFTFKIFAAADLDVVRLTTSTGVETTLVLNSNYSVTLNGDQNSNPGGSITLLAGALATGYTLVITSDIANLQPTDLTNQGGFYPEVITDALDRATIQIQQISDIGDRTLKIPITDGSLNMELPPAAERANTFLSFDANGLPSVVTAGSSGAPATITRQVFSGTGSQTVFTLASDPGALGNSAQVYIGGVYQQRSTYTIAGTTLTFSSAPVAGTDNIEFVNFLTSNIGSTSADLVTYTPTGTSAVARSAASKFGDVVSVKDFGAIGDGVTDDRAACQAAIDYVNSIGGGIVLFPPGTYLMSASAVVAGVDTYLSLNGYENIKLIGHGAILSSTYSSLVNHRVFFNLYDAIDIVIDGFRMQSTFARTAGTNTVTNYSAAAFRLGANTRECGNIRIENCDLQSVYYGMIVASISTNTNRVRNVSISNLIVNNSYYGLNFQNNGDDVYAANVRTNNVVRSYFPYGVDSHVIDYTSTNGDVFTDCLIKAYDRDTTNIRVTARIRSNTSADAKCTIESQHDPATQPTPNIVRNVVVEFDDTASTGALSLRFAYFQNAVQTATTNDLLFDNITIRGRCRNRINNAVTQRAASSEAGGILNIDDLRCDAGDTSQDVYAENGFFRLLDTTDAAGNPAVLVRGLQMASGDSSNANWPLHGTATASNWSGFVAGGNYSAMQFAKPNLWGGLWVRQKRGKSAIGSWAKLPGEAATTFAPQLRFGGGNTGMTGTFTGWYHKVGKLVFMSMDITLTAKGSSTGVATIANLPFTFRTGLYQVGNVVMYSNAAGITTPPTCFINSSASTMELVVQGTTSVTSMLDTNFTNTTRMFVTAVGVTDDTTE